MSWIKDEQPQNRLQYNRMIYMRRYRDKIKANETIWIKKSNIIYNGVSSN